jgi:hypothetical protein
MTLTGVNGPTPLSPRETASPLRTSSDETRLNHHTLPFPSKSSSHSATSVASKAATTFMTKLGIPL